MDQDDEVRFEFPGVFRLYRSGRIERLIGTTIVPTSVDSATGISTRDVTIDAKTGISARLYLPKLTTSDAKLPILVYFHGGAFCVESAFSPTYVPFITDIVSRANLLVVSVNYRMAPEHLLPTAYDDSWIALSWVVSPHAEDAWLRDHGDSTRVFVAGDSAGANIAHQMAIRAGEAGVAIERMVLVHPYFWGRDPVGLETTALGDRAWMEELWRIVNRPGVDLDDPTMNPMARTAPGLDKLGCRMKKVMVCVAEKDWLYARGREYCEALAGSGWGGEVVLVASAGEDHCFHLQKPGCKEAVELMNTLVEFFTRD